MKKLLYSFLLLSSATLFAQKNASTKFAVANDIVGTVDMFTANHKNAIQSTQTYKSVAQLPQSLKKYSFIAENGLVEYKLKSDQDGIDRIALSEINEQYGLAKDTPVIIDGYEFKNSDTKVFGDILNHMKVVDNNGTKAVSITTKN
ncbi:hypothetical protein [Chryseobacterium shandongense]|jgi:hypothetical protein|uniref:hypothetical protein n=1 Tax=Chryseobacterium shandongense TaxID=1493872 RepID=UPI000F4FCDCC|nr:hypothetical protein [Chryseobacterium shandongense]AZA57979.1 hypothetical protein EG350_12660 [Chryseobacterium shandongense]